MSGRPSDQPAALALEAGQRDAVREEIAALGRSLRDPAARRPWEELARAVDAGEVAGEQVARLEQVLAMSLETGRARRVQGPEAERALLRLFQQTPRGAAVRRLTDEANQALAALAGQALRSLAFTPQGPGTFRLEIATDLCQVAVEVARGGVSVESVGVGV